MSEYTGNENRPLEKIDITAYVDDFLHGLSYLWWVVLILTIGMSSLAFYRVNRNYSPVYTADATVAVYSVLSDSSQDTQTAHQLATVFPYILTSGLLSDIVAADLGMSYMPGSIRVSNIEGTNVLTISVTGSNPNQVYNVLWSVINNYPEVAQYVVGQTKMEVINDSGIPTDTNIRSVVFSSVRRNGMMGCLAGLFIVLLYSLSFRTVRTSADLQRLSHIQYLGTLPYCVKKKRRKNKDAGINILEDNTDSSYLESIRMIRARVERRLRHRNQRILMVTSSVPGEGKSTVAANLAIAMAQSGKKVILVDCDLRNPSARSIMNIKPEEKGLLEVLNGKLTWRQALQPFTDKGIPLWVLPGSKPTDRSELLATEKMKAMISEMKQYADLIILDTPPSAMLADAFMLIAQADATLYVVMSDYAKKQYIMQGINEIAETGIDICGCILNGGRVRSQYSGYYGYYAKSQPTEQGGTV